MKIRLLGPGYDKFTGEFGDVSFIDGVSVGEVTRGKARFFAALMSVEDVNGSGDPGENAQFQASLNMSAKVETLQTFAQMESAGLMGKVTQKEAPKDKPAATIYTQEMLEAIADKKGIAGVRVIAEGFGIKGSSIPRMISEILAKQGLSVPSQVEPAKEE